MPRSIWCPSSVIAPFALNASLGGAAACRRHGPGQVMHAAGVLHVDGIVAQREARSVGPLAGVIDAVDRRRAPRGHVDRRGRRRRAGREGRQRGARSTRAAVGLRAAAAAAAASAAAAPAAASAAPSTATPAAASAAPAAAAPPLPPPLLPPLPLPLSLRPSPPVAPPPEPRAAVGRRARGAGEGKDRGDARKGKEVHARSPSPLAASGLTRAPAAPLASFTCTSLCDSGRGRWRTRNRRRRRPPRAPEHCYGAKHPRGSPCGHVHPRALRTPEAAPAWPSLCCESDRLVTGPALLSCHRSPVPRSPARPLFAIPPTFLPISIVPRHHRPRPRPLLRPLAPAGHHRGVVLSHLHGRGPSAPSGPVHNHAHPPAFRACPQPQSTTPCSRKTLPTPPHSGSCTTIAATTGTSSSPTPTSPASPVLRAPAP